jgi:hypothetical protein
MESIRETFSNIRKYVDIATAEREVLKRKLNRAADNLIRLEKEQRRLEKAQAIVKEVSEMTQKEIVFQLSELSSMALAGIFPEPYQLEINFYERAGNSVAELSFERNGVNVDPLESASGGAADIVSFSLRISVWCLEGKVHSPIFIFDEPFKNINDPSRKMHRLIADVVKMICDKLGVQIIMVTLIPELIDVADVNFIFSARTAKGWKRSCVDARNKYEQEKVRGNTKGRGLGLASRRTK